MKRQLKKACLLALASCAAVISTAQAQTTLTFNRWLPPSHFVQSDVLEEWAKDIEKVTDGRVRVQVTGSSLAPPPRQFDLARDGVADIAWSVQGYTPGRFVTAEGLELPFLSDSAEALSVAFWRTHQKHFAKANEYKGVKVLSLHVQPPGELFTYKKPLTKLDDIKGLKIRVLNPATARLAEELGGVAVSAPSSKTYELISKGVVDGTFLTTDGVPQFKITDYVQHQMTAEGGFYNAAFFLVMNQRSWDRLSEQDRKAIESISGEVFAKRVGKAWDAEQDKAQKMLDERGVKHLRIEGKMLETLKTRLAGAEKDWVQAVGKLGIDGAAALEMIRREAASYKPD